MSRTNAQKAAARERAREDRGKIVERYRGGESMGRIASDYGVSDGWLALRFDEWSEPRRDFHAAHMTRRTKAEVESARAEFIAQREAVIQQYQGGESAAYLARRFGVSGTWVAERLDEWGVARRDRSAAAVVRGPGIRPL